MTRFHTSTFPSNMKAPPKTALITGGALRIGKALSQRLAEKGCNVAVHYRRSEEPARTLVRTLENLGVRAWAVPGNLDTVEGCDSLWKAAVSVAGNIDILVNNAAIFGRTPLREAHAEDFERFWRINTLAPVLLTRHFSRQAHLDPGGEDLPGALPRGLVINLLDQRIARPEAGTIPYALSKHALEAFTLAAALELAPRIRVNAIAPGAVLPPPGKRRIPEPAGHAPLPGRCTPSDIAEAAVFLLDSARITGQVLYVDAGQHLFSTEGPRSGSVHGEG